MVSLTRRNLDSLGSRWIPLPIPNNCATIAPDVDDSGRQGESVDDSFGHGIVALARGEEMITSWVREAFFHGGALCAFMSFIVVTSLRQNPMIWVHDAPPAIRAQIGPIDERTKRQKTMWGIVMLVGLVLIFGRLTVRVVEQYNDGYPGWLVFASALICFEMFNLFDALILDIGLAVFQPRWAMPPGIDMSALRDPQWHIRAFLLGTFLGLPFAGIVAGIGWIVHALSSLM